MAATITHGSTLPDSSNKSDFYGIIDAATISGIVNAEISATAAIAYSKLNLTDGILNADVNASAAIVDTKLATISTAGKVSGTAITSGDIAITNTATTTKPLSITASSLTTGNLAYLYSNSADTSSRNLVNIINDNALATGAIGLNIQQDSTGGGINITNGNGNAIYATCGTTTAIGMQWYFDNLTSGTGVYIYSNSADTTGRNIVNIINDHADADAAIPLRIQQDGAAVQIIGTSNENLSNAGVWTDRTSTYADKTEISPLVINGFIAKLKNLKLFDYKKKCEVFGNKVDVLSETEVDDNGKPKVIGQEYPKKVKHVNARTYQGFILDDPSTPEELISRNHKGEIDGISNALGVNFLLAVCQELIDRVEKLEAK